METSIKNWSDILPTLMNHRQIVQRNYQNLFSANHRAQMKAKYNFTEAEIVTVEELLHENNW